MSKQSYPNVLSLGMGDYVGIEADNGDNKLLLNRSNGIKTVNKAIYLQSKVAKITSAQLLSLGTIPITVIDAPGDGYSIVIDSYSLRHNGGIPYTGLNPASSFLIFVYNNLSGPDQIATIFPGIANLLNQATPQIRYAGNSSISNTTENDTTLVNNTAIVVQLLAEAIANGNFDLYLFINYYVIPTDYVA